MIPAARLIAVLLTVWLAGCDAAGSGHPWLHELDAGEGVRQSGARLMALAEGLHPLEPSASSTEILIGVHGFRSEGYEWVYPLQRLDTESTGTWFYRWDYSGCPAAAAQRLVAAINDLVTPATRKIHLIGHSYGGIVLATIVEDWPVAVPVDVHIVAAPLAGLQTPSRCRYETPTSIDAGVSLFQWRTRHALDGAFKDLPEDPQNISLAGSAVTRLPAQYKSHRLGHNRSLSWVADSIADARNPVLSSPAAAPLPQ